MVWVIWLSNLLVRLLTFRQVAADCRHERYLRILSAQDQKHGYPGTDGAYQQDCAGKSAGSLCGEGRGQSHTGGARADAPAGLWRTGFQDQEQRRDSGLCRSEGHWHKSRQGTEIRAVQEISLQCRYHPQVDTTTTARNTNFGYYSAAMSEVLSIFWS